MFEVRGHVAWLQQITGLHIIQKHRSEVLSCSDLYTAYFLPVRISPSADLWKSQVVQSIILKMKISHTADAISMILASVFITACMSAPLQVITVDGSCRSASQIGSYVSTRPISNSGNLCPVFGLVDCSSEGNGGTVFNSVLETTFEPNSRGENCISVYVVLDPMRRRPSSV